MNEQKDKNIVSTNEKQPGNGPASSHPAGNHPARRFSRGGGRPGGFGGRGGRPPAPKSEYKEKVLDLRRVSRVVTGGKRFRFRATLVIGDENGKVGVGIAKGLDVQSAVSKAKADAKKNLIQVPLNGRTIAHDTDAKFSAAKVLIKPAKNGHGLKAGGAVRVVLGLAGIQDATAKILGRTPNKLTNAMATIEALKKIKRQK